MSTKSNTTDPAKGPTLAEFRHFAETLDVPFDVDVITGCWRYYTRRGWRFNNGDPIRSDQWLMLLEAWEANAESRGII